MRKPKFYWDAERAWFLFSCTGFMSFGAFIGIYAGTECAVGMIVGSFVYDFYACSRKPK